MNNERTATLMATLEACAEARLEELAQARARVASLSEQNRRLEAHSHELEIKSQELEAKSHELECRGRELEHQHDELMREHRALGETCRELEEKFARAPHTADGHAHPRSQGLAALLSHRTRPEPAAAQVASHSPSASHSATSDRPGVPSRAHQAQAEASQGDPASESAPEPATNQAEGQGRLPIGEAPSPQALLNQWYRRYPDAFFKGHVRPLRVGIHEDLLARESWPEKLVRRALACYVHLPRYLKAVRQGAERVGLDGEAAGPVGEGEARYARKKLDELRAQQQTERRKQRRTGKVSESGKSAKNSESGKTPVSAPSARESSSFGSSLSNRSPSDAPASKLSSAPSPDPFAAPSPQEALAERMERKLGALLAKHSTR